MCGQDTGGWAWVRAAGEKGTDWKPRVDAEDRPMGFLKKASMPRNLYLTDALMSSQRSMLDMSTVSHTIAYMSPNIILPIAKSLHT